MKNVKCGVWSGKCGVGGSVKCKVRGLECKVWSGKIECGVWSEECKV